MGAIKEADAPDLIGEARSILADHRLDGYEELAALIARQVEGREALMCYIFDMGIKRWRKRPESQWSKRFEHALSAMEVARSDLSLPFILARSATDNEVRRRIYKLNTSNLSQPAFHTILKCEDHAKREGAIKVVSKLTPDQLQLLLDRHGLTPAWFAAFDAWLSTSKQSAPALIDAYCLKTIDALTGKQGSSFDDNTLLRCMERVITLAPKTLGRFGALFHEATFHAMARGDLTVSQECSTWHRDWLGKSLPTHREAHETISHATPVDALAHTLRAMNLEQRLEHFFSREGLGLERVKFDWASWERIAAGVDNAPAHEERLRLASLLLKASNNAGSYAKLEKLVRHWTEHGSNGSTRRAGHRRSKRPARGHLHQQAANDEQECWSRHHRGAAYINHIDSDMQIVSIVNHTPTSARRELEEHPPRILPESLRIIGLNGAPDTIAELLASPVLAKVNSLVFAPALEYHYTLGAIFGHMRFPRTMRQNMLPGRLDARQYTHRLMDDIWLAHILDALLHTDFMRRIDRLWLDEVRFGPRSIEVLMSWGERHGIPWSLLDIEGQFQSPSALRRLLSSPILRSLDHFSIRGSLGQPDPWDPVESWDELTALLPEHLRPIA